MAKGNRIAFIPLSMSSALARTPWEDAGRKAVETAAGRDHQNGYEGR